MTVTENLSRKSKSAGPHKNKICSRQKNRSWPQKANGSYTKSLTKKQKPRPEPERAKRQNAGPPQKHKLEMKCLRLTWTGGEVTDHYVGKRGAWEGGGERSQQRRNDMNNHY